MEEYGRRLLVELYSWKNMAEGCWLSSEYERIWQKVVGWYVYLKEYGRRLFAEMWTWKNMAEGCWLRYVHGRIWQKVVGWVVYMEKYGRRFVGWYMCIKE
jgi:hypothetical protein